MGYMKFPLWVVFSLSTLYRKRNFLCESFDRFLFLDAQADFDTCSSKEKTLKNDYHFALREDNSRTPDMLLHFYSSTQLPRNARGKIIRRKTDTFKK